MTARACRPIVIVGLLFDGTGTACRQRACSMRFRPILMTTMAALLAGVPMMLGTGAGSELRQPLGYTIVGGLILSQLLTLYTTPVVYIYLDELQTWLFRNRTKRLESSSVEQSSAR